MEKIELTASCWSCAKLKAEHGPRCQDVPTGTIHYCGRTDERDPNEVCRYWRPSQKWLDNQLWRAKNGYPKC